jgi:hypothetical protein
MKTLFSFTSLLITLSTLATDSKAQTTILIAPADLVVSRNYLFDISKLQDPNDPAFGRIVNDTTLRKPIITHDIVCSNYCNANLHIGYPAYKANVPPPKPAPFLACEYFNQLYESTQPNKKFDLDWGLDGYIENGSTNDPVISILDQRHCGQGVILRIYQATDQNNVSIRDTQTIWFIDCDYAPPANLVCLSNLNLILDEYCGGTIDAQLLLVGTGHCFDFYTVELRDWITNQIIDRDKNKDESQIGIADIGRTIKFIVTDPTSGAHCDGTLMARDNTPPTLTCPQDLTISCKDNDLPLSTGIATWKENCGGIQLTYSDFTLYGTCDKVFAKIIRRTWTAIDVHNNRSTCLQEIQINNSTLSDLVFPPDFNDIDQPSLKCHEMIDTNLNISNAIMSYPNCVGGFLLDSAYWYSHSVEPDVYPNRRIPRELGWNIVRKSNSSNYYHPNPETIYYPTHKDWNLAYQYCWGEDQHVMWKGTGLPSHSGCSSIAISYKDSIVRNSIGICVQEKPSCYTLYRFWNVLDFCTGELAMDTQIIIVKDVLAPKILYPDTVTAQIMPFNCQGRLDIPPSRFIDDCSAYVHFTVESDSGVISGNETMGYIISQLNLGFQTATLIAEDCCGNSSSKKIVIRIIDNSPPIAVCVKNRPVTITGNQAPGNNYAKLFADIIDDGSFDNCGPIVFKVIRSDNLGNSKNGSEVDQPTGNIDCNKFNGDDNLNTIGNQIYFDDYTNYCCEDIGRTLSTILRVFDKDPGPGPVSPSRMDSLGDLYNHFSDCISLIEVQDKTVPTVVAPSNIVVSCEFQFNLNDLSNPNDSTFGRIVTSLSDRKKVFTSDKVCYNFCVKNDTIDYPGDMPGSPPSNPPAPNRACDYYHNLYDSIHPDRTYEMVWGFDGYVLSGCGSTPTITVEDLRKCGQGKINRKITAMGPNGIKVNATQTIWVVGCEPHYPLIKIINGNSSDPNNGTAVIQLNADLHSNCYSERFIKLSYEIDEFNDGLGKYNGFDYKVGPLSEAERSLGLMPQFMDNPRAFQLLNTADASGRYPFGKHRIRWKAEDDCGNVGFADELFETNTSVTTYHSVKDATLKVVPNPNDGNLLIYSEPEVDLIKLTTAAGILYQHYIPENHHKLTLHNVQEGIFLIHTYKNGNLVSIAKMVVIH